MAVYEYIQLSAVYMHAFGTRSMIGEHACLLTKDSTSVQSLAEELKLAVWKTFLVRFEKHYCGEYKPASVSRCRLAAASFAFRLAPVLVCKMPLLTALSIS